MKHSPVALTGIPMYIFLGILGGFLLFVIIKTTVGIIKKRIENNKYMKGDFNEKEKVAEPKAVRAKVASLSADDGYVRKIHHIPVYTQVFSVTFKLLTSGKTKTLNVPEKTFAKLKKDDEGVLVYLNDVFYDFK